MTSTVDGPSAMWARQNAEWRDPSQVASQWQDAVDTDPRMLEYSAKGKWWETLAKAGITLLVTHEYEHLVMAVRAGERGPRMSYMRLPHPSGLAVDHERGKVHIASTRNPNQVFDLEPVTGRLPRLDVDTEPGREQERVMLPVRSHFYPGCLYMHDLAMVGGELHANSVGQNCVVRFTEEGYERVWWPRCIERDGEPVFGQNHIQLNSIAAGESLESSYFSASAEKMSARRPGHRNFPVDRRGVIFSGATREPMARGLTRPHSARLHEGRVWVDNSGYGELGYAEDGRFVPTVWLPGWTRGLCFHEHIAFVGTSRVIPRFRQYAPGLDVDASLCGVHAVDIQSGEVLGSLLWPYGNQIFAIDWVPSCFSTGFPFQVGGKRATRREKTLFYSFTTEAK